MAGSRLLAGLQKGLGRNGMKAKRAAIKVQNKTLPVVAKTVNKLEGTKRGLEMAALNPGAATSKAIGETIRHPVTMASQVAGKATMVIDPTGTGLVPLGAIGTAAEVGLRKAVPRYARATDRLAGKYEKSKASQIITGIGNGVVNSLRSFG